MITANTISVRDNFKNFCDIAANGEPVIVSRTKNKNVVLVSETEFRKMEKVYNNAQYLAKIDEAMQSLKKGNVKTITDEEAKKLGLHED
ncbi:MAG: type II toxin-antitoxin system Phd/YefM family antitoxin [Spirochaetia bacterium]|jgi:antitoxin YefM|nr:type II toxin-antitoxin system Phd/YefM family antitoxin [Spirochaetia bacterium]